MCSALFIPSELCRDTQTKSFTPEFVSKLITPLGSRAPTNQFLLSANFIAAASVFFFFFFFSELISPQPRGKRAASPARVCLWLTLLIALAWQNAWLLGLIKDKIRLFFHCVSTQRSCEEKRVKEAQVSLITLATARSAEPCQRPYSCVPLTC